MDKLAHYARVIPTNVFTRATVQFAGQRAYWENFHRPRWFVCFGWPPQSCSFSGDSKKLKQLSARIKVAVAVVSEMVSSLLPALQTRRRIIRKCTVNCDAPKSCTSVLTCRGKKSTMAPPRARRQRDLLCNLAKNNCCCTILS